METPPKMQKKHKPGSSKIGFSSHTTAKDACIAYMAASKAPKHDFAPAWLKIPEQNNQKTSGAKSSEHQEKNNYHRRKDFPFDYPYGGMVPRQRSFDHYFDERHFAGQKFRQRSLEEDYYENPAYYNGYYNGYPGGTFHPGPGNFRDIPYPPHNGMNGRFAHMNGAYPAYLEQYNYDFYPDRFSNSGRPPMGRKSHHKIDKDTRSVNSGKNEKVNVEPEEKDEKNGDKDQQQIEEEFPSLSGEIDAKDDAVEKTKIPSGVWDKNTRGKILQSNKEPNINNVNNSKNADNSNRDIKHNHTYIYKALIPNKSKVAKRGSKDNAKLGSLAKDINSNNSTYSRQNKENTIESPSTPPIDILNTRLVTTPKNLSDKKSDFLKALKQGNDLNTTENCTRQKDPKAMEFVNGIVGGNASSQQSNGGFVNGFEDLSLNGSGAQSHDGSSILSSSLEAEQRLLREMGWSEDDEQNPITEEEMKEFQQLSKQMKQLKEQKNGLKRSLPKTWSPQHLPMYSPMALTQHLNSSTLSSDSDSDSDLG